MEMLGPLCMEGHKDSSPHMHSAPAAPVSQRNTMDAQGATTAQGGKERTAGAAAAKTSSIEVSRFPGMLCAQQCRSSGEEAAMGALPVDEFSGQPKDASPLSTRRGIGGIGSLNLERKKEVFPVPGPLSLQPEVESRRGPEGTGNTHAIGVGSPAARTQLTKQASPRDPGLDLRDEKNTVMVTEPTALDKYLAASRGQWASPRGSPRGSFSPRSPTTAIGLAQLRASLPLCQEAGPQARSCQPHVPHVGTDHTRACQVSSPPSPGIGPQQKAAAVRNPAFAKSSSVDGANDVRKASSWDGLPFTGKLPSSGSLRDSPASSCKGSPGSDKGGSLLARRNKGDLGPLQVAFRKGSPSQRDGAGGRPGEADGVHSQPERQQSSLVSGFDSDEAEDWDYQSKGKVHQQHASSEEQPAGGQEAAAGADPAGRGARSAGASSSLSPTRQRLGAPSAAARWSQGAHRAWPASPLGQASRSRHGDVQPEALPLSGQMPNSRRADAEAAVQQLPGKAETAASTASCGASSPLGQGVGPCRNKETGTLPQDLPEESIMSHVEMTKPDSPDHRHHSTHNKGGMVSHSPVHGSQSVHARSESSLHHHHRPWHPDAGAHKGRGVSSHSPVHGSRSEFAQSEPSLQHRPWHPDPNGMRPPRSPGASPARHHRRGVPVPPSPLASMAHPRHTHQEQGQEDQHQLEQKQQQRQQQLNSSWDLGAADSCQAQSRGGIPSSPSPHPFTETGSRLVNSTSSKEASMLRSGDKQGYDKSPLSSPMLVLATATGMPLEPSSILLPGNPKKDFTGSALSRESSGEWCMVGSVLGPPRVCRPSASAGGGGLESYPSGDLDLLLSRRRRQEAAVLPAVGAPWADEPAGSLPGPGSNRLWREGSGNLGAYLARMKGVQDRDEGLSVCRQGARLSPAGQLGPGTGAGGATPPLRLARDGSGNLSEFLSRSSKGPELLRRQRLSALGHGTAQQSHARKPAGAPQAQRKEGRGAPVSPGSPGSQESDGPSGVQVSTSTGKVRLGLGAGGGGEAGLIKFALANRHKGGKEGSRKEALAEYSIGRGQDLAAFLRQEGVDEGEGEEGEVSAAERLLEETKQHAVVARHSINMKREGFRLGLGLEEEDMFKRAGSVGVGEVDDPIRSGLFKPRGLKFRDYILGQPYEDVRNHFAMHKKELGKGQFGVVRKCKDIKTGKVFACKSIGKKKIKCAEDAEDIRREVACMKLVQNHPGFVHLQDAFEDSEGVHIIMELCKGGDLLDFVQDNGPLKEGEAARLLKTVVEALLHCHCLGIVHRDVKPENILLINPLSKSEVKLVDFGVSSFFQPDKPLTEVIGTPEYMAPEVLKHSYSCQADIWSAGVVLYIALTAIPPFWASSRQTISDSILTKEASFKSTKWARISEEGKDLVRKMLKKDPRKRITAGEILTHPWVLRHGADSGISY